jgi:hypothetical protein
VNHAALFGHTATASGVWQLATKTAVHSSVKNR